MRKLIARTVFAGAFAMLAWAAGTANAVTCTNISDMSTCKAENKCINAIAKYASGYVSGMQIIAQTVLKKSTTAGETALPKYYCVGGPNNGKVCIQNNDPVASTTPPKVGYYCNYNPGSGSYVNDIPECQPWVTANDFSKDAQKAAGKLLANIKKDCCVTKSLDGKSCVTEVDPSIIGIQNLKLCPGAAATVATSAGPLYSDVWEQLATCIEESIVGPKAPLGTTDKIDMSDGEFGPTVADSTQAVIHEVVGSATSALRPQNKPGKATTDPFMVDQFAGSQLLQIGTATGAPTISSGGTDTYLSLRHCIGGNNANSCTKNADCKNLATKVLGNCVQDCDGDLCAMRGPHADKNVLIINPTCSAAVSLATCLVSKNMDAGNGTPAAGSIDLSIGKIDLLSPITTQVWSTSPVGGGVQPGCNCDTFVHGACPLCLSGHCTGHCVQTPCTTCTSDTDCPGGLDICSADGVACTAADGTVTQQCLPKADANNGAGVDTADIPNPMMETTGSSELSTPVVAGKFCGFCDYNIGGNPLTDAACDHAPAPNQGDVLCAHGCKNTADCLSLLASELNGKTGFCDGDADFTHYGTACSSNGDCGGLLGACHAVECDFGKTVLGFQGNSAVTSIKAVGQESIFTPVMVGAFCTGMTNDTLLDGSAGLPGPVRVVAPYVQSYRFGP
jgi:hypothetical protein